MEKTKIKKCEEFGNGHNNVHRSSQKGIAKGRRFSIIDFEKFMGAHCEKCAKAGFA